MMVKKIVKKIIMVKTMIIMMKIIRIMIIRIIITITITIIIQIRERERERERERVCLGSLARHKGGNRSITRGSERGEEERMKEGECE